MTDTTPGAIGNTLRDLRLQKNLTLTDVANATRISSSFLKALEEERWADFPARVYLEGFLRNYADHLGLNGEDLVRQLKSQLGQAQKPDFTHPGHVTETPGDETEVQARLPLVLLSLVFVVLAVLFFYRTHEESARVAPVALNDVTPPSPAPVSPAPVPPPATGHTLAIQARDAVWLRVWLDGVVRYEGTLAARESRRWPFQTGFRLRAGNASRVGVEVDGTAVATTLNANPGEFAWPAGDAGWKLAAPVRPPVRAPVLSSATVSTDSFRTP